MVEVYSSSSDALNTAFTSLAGQIVESLDAIAPIAITIVGAFLIWKFGIKFFKSLAGK